MPWACYAQSSRTHNIFSVEQEQDLGDIEAQLLEDSFQVVHNAAFNAHVSYRNRRQRAIRIAKPCARSLHDFCRGKRIQTRYTISLVEAGKAEYRRFRLGIGHSFTKVEVRGRTSTITTESSAAPALVVSNVKGCRRRADYAANCARAEN
jgi:hypothetical protein